MIIVSTMAKSISSLKREMDMEFISIIMETSTSVYGKKIL